MSYICVQMAFPVFHEFDANGTIRTNGLHWEGFPRLAWEALSAAGYLTPPTYEVKEFERYRWAGLVELAGWSGWLGC
jgi:hypothetical protein